MNIERYIKGIKMTDDYCTTSGSTKQNRTLKRIYTIMDAEENNALSSSNNTSASTEQNRITESNAITETNQTANCDYIKMNYLEYLEKLDNENKVNTTYEDTEQAQNSNACARQNKLFTRQHKTLVRNAIHETNQTANCGYTKMHYLKYLEKFKNQNKVNTTSESQENHCQDLNSIEISDEDMKLLKDIETTPFNQIIIFRQRPRKKNELEATEQPGTAFCINDNSGEIIHVELAHGNNKAFATIT